MKQVITALVVQVEVTNYNEAGQVAQRPEMPRFVAIEADIPEPVLEWVQQVLARGRV